MEYFNPHSNNWLLNKFESYSKLRTLDKAHYDEKYNVHLITRYDDVRFALSDHNTFSSAKGNLIVESEDRFEMTLGASDDPIHTIYKNIAFAAYSKENIQRISECVTGHIKRLLKKDTFNISEVIEEISAWTTVEVLNIPYDKEYVKNLIMDMQRHSSKCVSVDIDDRSQIEMTKLLVSLTTINSVKPTGPGIYHEYMNNNPTGATVLSLFTGPCISGTSSLTGALQFLTLDLARENQLESLLENRSLIPLAINESLRFNASTGRFSRTVTRDIMLHNVNLKPGDRVAVCLESANRDPDVFENPDIFDIHRNTSRHLGFGYGAHACIALAISKAIMNIYLDALLENGPYRVITDTKYLKYVMTASGNDDMISNIIIERKVCIK
jgi:cytochrome P450